MTDWEPTDAEPLLGGTVGGDGAGESWSVRFARKDDPTHTATVYLYPVDMSERHGEERAAQWEVEQMFVTETWADSHETDDEPIDADYTYEYRDFALTDEATQGEAERAAQNMARNWWSNGALYINWTP